jgi:hypothetical protein
MAKVYVSSTILDLKLERQTVMDWLRAARHQAVDSYLPNSETVRESCLDDVDTCDLYVLILGHRYGFQPEEANPEKLSITHLEFRRAGQSGIPRIALIRTSVPDIRLSDVDDPQRGPLVRVFRKEVQREVRVAEFSDLTGLIQGLSTGVQSELDKLRRKAEEHALLAEYRAYLRERYAFLQLAGIPTPVKRDIPLDRVYIKLRALPEKKLEREPDLEPSGHATINDTLDAFRRLGEHQWQQGHTERMQKYARDVVTVEHAINQHRCIVMIGTPGAGKSTLVRYITRQHAADVSALLPLCIPLRKLDTFLIQKTPALLEAILDLLMEHTEGAARARLREVIANRIAQKQVRFFFDGLDEVRFRRQDVLDGLIALAASGHAIVVTSRPIGYQRLNGYQHYGVLSLLPNDEKSFADRWFNVLADTHDTPVNKQHAWALERANWLKEQVADRPSLREVATNPLMLTFLAVLAGDEPRRELPRCRKDLYREYVERLFTTWEAHRQSQGKLAIGGFRGETAKNVSIRGLYQIALLLHYGYYSDSHDPLPTRTHVEQALGTYFTQAWQLGPLYVEMLPIEIIDFWSQAGLLDIYRLGEHEWMLFRHQTFQEYGAARALAQQYTHDLHGLWNKLTPYLFRPSWSEIVTLALACLTDTGVDATTLVGLLVQNGEHEQSVFLAARALADGAVVDEKTRQQTLQILYQRTNKEGDEPQKSNDAFQAMISIGWTYPRTALPFLMNLTTATITRLRVRAGEAIAKIGLKEEALPILQHVAADLETPTKWKIVAAWALGRFGYIEEAVSILQKELAIFEAVIRKDTGRRSWYVDDRYRIAGILLELGQQKLGEKVYAALADDSEIDSFVRLSAAKALLEICEEAKHEYDSGAGTASHSVDS